MWRDVAMITFSCVAVNHLGLVRAVEERIRHTLPVLDCPKCLTFWCSLAYTLWVVGLSDIPMCLAASFAASYAAVWLNLVLGITDYIYNNVYDKVFSTAYRSADVAEHTDGEVSVVRESDSGCRDAAESQTR